MTPALVTILLDIQASFPGPSLLVEIDLGQFKESPRYEVYMKDSSDIKPYPTGVQVQDHNLKVHPLENQIDGGDN